MNGESIQDMEGSSTVRSVSSLPRAFIEDHTVEPRVSGGRPDIVINPFDFEEDVYDEDHRYHRLPIGVLSSVHRHVVDIETAIRTDQQLISHIIMHGDNKVEPLLFPTLYPHGRGHWCYRHIKIMESRDPRYASLRK
jgi:hypothetical protein